MARTRGRMRTKTDNELLLLQAVSQNVRRLRQSAGLTVDQASARSGVHPRTLQRIEAGMNADMKSLAGISVALEVDVAELFRPLQSKR